MQKLEIDESLTETEVQYDEIHINTSHLFEKEILASQSINWGLLKFSIDD